MPSLFLFILLIPLHFQASSADLSSDRAILLSMKQHWGNPSSLESWNSASSPLDWPEVESTQDAVTRLYLPTKYLGGTIPSTICQLKNLISIDLSGNEISGHIPVCLHNCSNLVILDLAFNHLSGPIPGKFSRMKMLRTLRLTKNELSGKIPKGLGKLPGLGYVDLSDNQLSGDIVENVFHLRNPAILRLQFNNFSGKIPYEFVSQYFTKDSLDRSNFCSNNGTEGLPSCPSSLCSNHRIRAYLKCNSRSRHFLIIILGAVGGAIMGFAILCYIARKCWIKKLKKVWLRGPSLKDREEWNMISFQKVKFDKDDIVSNLTHDNLIGDGGSGKVYRVFINQTGNTVAVKSISNATKSEQSLEKEFLAEIQTLGDIRHYNIVKLLCYISGDCLKLLVYQYFENNCLHQWLHGNKREASSISNSPSPKLDWPMRLHIAIGVAQGLCYMHHDCSPPIIHRDIKSRNILLDSDFNAKIADFGLAKLLNRHVDTMTASAVAGTFGYIAPEYAYTQKVSPKTDVYSFGVVLLELTTGKEAVTREDYMSLAERAQLLYRDENAIVDALDADIVESICMDQVIAVFRLGVICTSALPSNRPSMKDCLHILQKCSHNFSALSPLALRLSDYDSLV